MSLQRGVERGGPARGPSSPPRARATDTSAHTVAGVPLTSPERVLWEEMGITKVALARYYEAVADWIVPELRGRPLSLVRCPRGPGEGCFYQKHIDASFPGGIERIAVQEANGEGIYAMANAIEAVVGLVQMGVIELHAGGSAMPDLDKPDRMVFDLDPDAGLAWREIVAAARLTRDRLEALGLDAFLKTSGGKGLHVVVPLARHHEWDEVREFARALAESMAGDDPGLFTVKMAKKERPGRIFIDYLRNAPGATTVAAYSVRAKPGAPVSTPLHWDELGTRMKPASHHAGSVPRRLLGLRSDPWKAFRRSARKLTAPMRQQLGLDSR